AIVVKLRLVVAKLANAPVALHKCVGHGNAGRCYRYGHVIAVYLVLLKPVVMQLPQLTLHEMQMIRE
ncbi:MAG TPA: hypothetical protein VM187_10690, partial [Niastella sp.]|nr:hypothetical protein [Niastella sp.]